MADNLRCILTKVNTFLELEWISIEPDLMGLPYLSVFSFLKYVFINLKVRVTQGTRETDTQREGIEVPSTVSLRRWLQRQGQSQESGAPSNSMWGQGSNHLSHPLLLSQTSDRELDQSGKAGIWTGVLRGWQHHVWQCNSPYHNVSPLILPFWGGAVTFYLNFWKFYTELWRKLLGKG